MGNSADVLWRQAVAVSDKVGDHDANHAADWGDRLRGANSQSVG